MVSFQCEACNDVLTKKKLDPHTNRCWNASFTCIDCMTHFQGTAYRAHTSCISEAQKYQGALYKEKPAKQKKMTPTNGNQDENQIARLQVPPPAPSPPRPNVFDFLVTGNNKSPSSDSSTRGSDADESLSSAEPSPAQKSRKEYREGVDFTYGAGPVPKTFQRFDSNFSLDIQPHKGDKFGPPIETLIKTPHNKSSDQKNQQSNGTSDKKRKRVEDLDLSVVPKDKGGLLHSGLTGGLSKLMEKHEEEASPLSPKKKTKRAKDDQVIRYEQPTVEKRHKKPIKMKAIEAGPRRQLPHQSHSEFFLSLIDKGHKSSKGQSIYGVLKDFHDGVYADSTNTRSVEDEKKLFRGLRMKINKQGEIVLFSRPDKELDD